MIVYELRLFCSVNATVAIPHVASILFEEEDEASGPEPEEVEVSKPSTEPAEGQLGQLPLDLQLKDDKTKELDKEGKSEVSIKTNLKPGDINESTISALSSNKISHKEGNINKQDVESLVSSQSFEAGGQQKVPLPKFGSTNMQQASTRASLPEGPRHVVKDFSMAGTQTFSGFGSGAFSFAGKTQADSAGQLNHKDIRMSVEIGKQSPAHVGLTSLPSSFSQSSSSRKFISSKDTDVKSPFIPSSCIQDEGSKNADLNSSNIPSNLPGKLVHYKETVGTSTAQNSANRLVQSWGHRSLAGPGSIESLPSIRSSQVSSQENVVLGDSAHHKHHPSKENYKTLPQSGMLNSEPVLSKQFGNVMNISYHLFLQHVSQT